MRGVLVVAHGSRAKETEATLEAILKMVKGEMPETVIECAFMEFSERTVERGIAALAEKGVTEIKVVPYFLFMGIHLREDIPQMAGECVKNYPGIKLIMGKPLGVYKRLGEIRAERRKE